jgi:hypothetical protein
MVGVAGRPMAQTVMGGSLQGTVIGTTGQVLEEATVEATNTATGERWQTLTRAGGRYAFEHVGVGGPYRLQVRAVGFAPGERDGVFVSQGRRVWQDFQLSPSTLRLEELTVRSGRNPELDAGRTGPVLTLPESTFARLPLATRDFGQYALLSPLVTPTVDGNLSFGGEQGVLNSVLVDGSRHNSFRGGGADGFGGIPGTQNEFGYFDIVPEALQEIQVMTAPFDVRYGNFTGGLISAVTKSGTNSWTGSVFGYLNSPSLAGHNPDGTRLDPFTRQEFGVTLGGPIARDRLAFFIQAGGNHNRYPATTSPPDAITPDTIDSTIGISYSSVTRFAEILRDRYGVDPGTFLGTDRSVSIGRGFAKLTAQLGVNNRLELSQSFLHESPRLFDEHDRGFIAFTSGGAYDPNEKLNTRIEWTTAFGGGWTNQATLLFRQDRHRCFPSADFVRIEVAADSGGLQAGQQRFCIGANNVERVWEVDDNLELAAGAHQFTFGTHNELVRLTDEGAGDPGQWFFDSLAALAQGLPSGYERFVPGPDSPARVRLRVTQLGFYLQDRWTPNARLTLTAGLRADVPWLTDKPPENSELLDALGVSSAVTPSGRLLWSPRLGWNFDLSARKTAFLRGGVGLFSGPPAYAWLGNAYSDVGSVDFRFLQCVGDQVPAFSLDPSAQPSDCADAPPNRPTTTVFDRNFRYPRDLKIDLGADLALPWELVGSTDLLFTRGVNQFAERDLNLGPPAGFASGEGGRPLYGTIDSMGDSHPNHLSPAFDAVTEITNGSGNRAYTLVLQLRKRFRSTAEVVGAYTYTNARDRTDSPGLTGRGNLGLSVLDGTWENPRLSTSLWSRSHKVTVFTTANLPLGMNLGLAYLGLSGAPLTYIVNGDANADGFDNLGAGRFNDAVYVPRDADDITLAPGEQFELLDQYIEQEPCLREHRGELLRRNSCREPWSGRLDARLSERVPGLRSHILEVVADFFNVLNMIDHNWGQVRRTVEDFGGSSVGNRIGLLELVGYDAVRSRGVYRILTPGRRVLDIDATRWRVQLSLRYLF